MEVLCKRRLQSNAPTTGQKNFMADLTDLVNKAKEPDKGTGGVSSTDRSDGDNDSTGSRAPRPAPQMVLPLLSELPRITAPDEVVAAVATNPPAEQPVPDAADPLIYEEAEERPERQHVTVVIKQPGRNPRAKDIRFELEVFSSARVADCRSALEIPADYIARRRMDDASTPVYLSPDLYIEPGLVLEFVPGPRLTLQERQAALDHAELKRVVEGSCTMVGDEVGKVAKRVEELAGELREELKNVGDGLAKEMKTVKETVGKDLKGLKGEVGKEGRAMKTEVGKEVKALKEEIGKEMQTFKADVGKEVTTWKAEVGKAVRSIQANKESKVPGGGRGSKDAAAAADAGGTSTTTASDVGEADEVTEAPKMANEARAVRAVRSSGRPLAPYGNDDDDDNDDDYGTQPTMVGRGRSIPTTNSRLTPAANFVQPATAPTPYVPSPRRHTGDVQTMKTGADVRRGKRAGDKKDTIKKNERETEPALGGVRKQPLRPPPRIPMSPAWPVPPPPPKKPRRASHEDAYVPEVARRRPWTEDEAEPTTAEDSPSNEESEG